MYECLVPTATLIFYYIGLLTTVSSIATLVVAIFIGLKRGDNNEFK